MKSEGDQSVRDFRYGDIYPITPIGRIIACLCSLFGAAMIGMLVSVLVDRYQRVYARKLYIQEEMIDFDEQSNDEMETNSASLNQPQIEDPDQRSRINSGFHSDSTTEITQSPPELNNDDGINRQNSRVHFIIGYVDDQSQQTSSDLLETISSIVVDKQTIDENIRLSIISPDGDDLQVRLSSMDDVQFDVSSISDEEFTEIGAGHGKKGNVLKTFSSNNRVDFSPSEKHV